MSPLLETKRLLIRNFQSSDAPALHEMILQYEASGMAAYDQSWPTTPGEVQQVTDWFATGDHFLAVCLKRTGQFIGFVALNPEQDGVYNLGYIFNFDFHGKGYASEACRAVLAHAFENRQASAIVSATAALNHASCRLLGRLGFTVTGENRASFRNAPDGSAIVFVGRSYRLSRETWLRGNRFSGLG